MGRYLFADAIAGYLIKDFHNILPEGQSGFIDEVIAIEKRENVTLRYKVMLSSVAGFLLAFGVVVVFPVALFQTFYILPFCIPILVVFSLVLNSFANIYHAKEYIKSAAAKSSSGGCRRQRE